MRPIPAFFSIGFSFSVGLSSAIVALLLTLRLSPAYGETLYEGNKYVDISLIADVVQLQPQSTITSISHGRSARVGLHFALQPGWHIYWENSGDAGLPTTVKWTLPEGWNISKTNYPLPWKFIEAGDIVTFGYQDSVLLWAEIFDPQEPFRGEKMVSIKADIKFLACNNKCLPGKLSLSKDFAYSSESELAPSDQFHLFEEAEATTPLIHTDANPNRSVKTGELLWITEVARPAFGKIQGISSLIFNIPLKKKISIDSLQSSLQIFPRAFDGLSWGEAVVRESTVLETSAAQAYVLLPFTNEGEGTKHPAKLTGVIAFAPELTGLARPLSLNWTVHSEDHSNRPATGSEKPEAENLAASQLNQSTSGLSKGDGSVLKLTYRLGIHETDGNIENLKTAIVEDRNHYQISSKEEFSTSNMHSSMGIWLALLFAFFAGMMLNLMPCVLPVISLKLFSLVELRNQSSKKVRSAVLGYVSGICLTLLVLAGIVIFLQNAGQQVGWGFQFQSPQFVASLALIVFALSQSFFGLYTLHIPGLHHLLDKGGIVDSESVKGDSERSVLSQVIEGILAVLLSTPCTAPFLGGALAFAFSQSWWVVVLVNLSVGLGLSFPYAIVALNPRLAALLPKPGSWMNEFKHLMGFFLLATSLWLLFVLQSLVGSGALWLIVISFGISFYFWILKATAISTSGIARFTLRGVCGLAVLCFAIYFWPIATKINTDRASVVAENETWQNYDPVTWNRVKSEAKTILLDFTADWCITCKVNESLVLNRDELKAAFTSCGVRPIRLDWTAGNDDVSKLLREYGGRGVPHYVVVHQGGEWEVLPSLLTTTMVKDAVCKTR